MKVSFSYKQNEHKTVSQYVSAPLLIDAKEITDYVYGVLDDLVIASGGKTIVFTDYTMFEEPATFEYDHGELYWIK